MLMKLFSCLDCIMNPSKPSGFVVRTDEGKSEKGISIRFAHSCESKIFKAGF